MENTFPRRSPLIAPELEQQLMQLFARITEPVALTCILDEGEKSQEMAGLINHLADLCDKISCRFLAPGEDPELDGVLDARLLPAAGIGSADAAPRMIFHGVPGGREMTSFASAVLTAGGGAKPLDKYTLKDIARIRRPMQLQICVSLGCHHCAQLVMASQRVAYENPLVTAHMIDANLYPSLVEKYAIARVPLLIVDGDRQYPGGKSMGELTSLLYKI